MRWQFNVSQTIEDIAFNSILEKFYQYGIRGLVRENIQNSLDARLNLDEPVRITITMGEHYLHDIPNISEIVKRVNTLKSGNSYTLETIEDMKSILLNEKFRYITFEDNNTKGLSGSNLGYPSDKKCNYNAYAYTKGLHFEDEDYDMESIRGGSHGVGKIASNAASHLYLMYFANNDEFNNKTLGGTVQLIDHHYEGSNYRATGYFADKILSIHDNEVFLSIKNEGFNPIFKKETRGLKIIIPFLRNEFYDRIEIIKTVVDSFLIAILSGNLVVELEDITIDIDNIEEIINNPIYFSQDDIDNDNYYTKLYFKTLKNLYDDNFVIENNGSKYVFKLYFSTDSSITNGRCGVFRTIGMKIEDRKIRAYSQRPFNAILVPKTYNCDVMLKTLENESHTQLEHKHIKNESIKTRAKNFLRDLNAKLKEVIDKETRKLYPDEENMETSDILFEVENSFREQLEKKYAEINIGSKAKPRTIIRVNPTTEEGDSPGKTGKRNGNGVLPYKRIKKTFGNSAAKSYAVIPNTSVKRVVINDKEQIFISLPNIETVTQKDNCNLLVSIVDGMGQEMQNELILTSVYKHISDENQSKFLSFDAHCIKEVRILDSKIKLTCELSNNVIKFYKLKYYLEV